MSYIIIELSSSEAILEVNDNSLLNHLNYDKYDFMGVKYYLEELSVRLNGGLTYKDKASQGLLK